MVGLEEYIAVDQLELYIEDYIAVAAESCLIL